MYRRAFLILVGSSAATIAWDTRAAVSATSLRTINAMPAFWNFWDTTLGEPAEVRVSEFFSKVVDVYPRLFSRQFIGGPLADQEDAPEVRARVSKYLREVQPAIPTMRMISATIRNRFAGYVREFSKVFIDYAPNTPVYFSVSLFGFSGGLLVSGENSALYFGVDELARIYGQHGNLKVIFQHELFHQYHFQIAPEISSDRAAWAFMWEEGLATYVSQRMNPGATLDEVLVTPLRLSELAKPHLVALSRRLLEQADSTNPGEYSDLFTTEQTPDEVPPRSGYFVGYKVAERLAATRSLVDLVHLQGPELRRAVLRTLSELQKSP
jgi:hypothetical protein